MNIFNIKRAFEDMEKKGWDSIIWLIDTHDTISKADYQESHSMDPFPNAMRVLRQLSLAEHSRIVLWTCSWPQEVEKQLQWFTSHAIEFDAINSFKVDNTKYGYYLEKPYANIILDDKAGFEPEIDWFIIEKEMKRVGRWDESLVEGIPPLETEKIMISIGKNTNT